MFHILTQFSAAVTYSMFVTLGLITSVPVSAGEHSFLKLNETFKCAWLNVSPLNLCSIGHCFVWGKFCWYEVSWSHSNSDWILFSNVSVLFRNCEHWNWELKSRTCVNLFLNFCLVRIQQVPQQLARLHYPLTQVN